MSSKITMILGALLVVGLNSCASYSLETAWPEPRPLGKDLATYRPPEHPSTAIQASLQVEEPTGVITLRQALPLALMRNPELIAFSWEVRALEARTLQTGLLPNPEVSTVVENIGGAPATVTGGVQTTILLSQLIELGGKRPARIRAASLTSDLAGWDYETKRIDIFTQVAQSFIEVLSAQEGLSLTEEIVLLAKKVAKTISETVKAGKVSPIEETRANVALSSVEIDLERAKRALEEARKRLAATWGSTTPRFEKVEGELDSIPSSIPSVEQLTQRLSQNPELARWAVEISQRQAVIDMERSKAIPDITVGGGYRRFNETGDNVFIVEVSIPLPFFNRNQGGILEAHNRLAKAEKEREAIEVRVTTALAKAYKALSTAHAEVMTLKTSILPGAQDTFDAIEEGYRAGKFDYLDLLDAQRTLFNSQIQYLRALTEYHKAVADIERLIGEPLDAIRNTEEQK